MGMFDYVRSSYPLPEAFMTPCQTTDIEDGYGGSMSDFWIDPAGYLWVGYYSGCSELELYEEGHPRYNAKCSWMNYDWVPTGKHGKFRVHPITKYIVISPNEWKGDLGQRPQLQLHFKGGKLQDFEQVRLTAPLTP